MPRCLIVDDDRDGREGYAEYLRAFGFDVEECADGASAWRRLQKSAPDIILLDLQLPKLSGWDLVARIRTTERLKKLPVVAFSACVFPDDKQRADEAGCNVFLTKPSLPADVLAELNRSLGIAMPHSSGTRDA